MNINQPYPNLDVNGNPVLSTTTATNHGLFYTTRAIPDGKTFYCPGVTSDMSERLTYENYLTTSGQWPAYSRIDNAFVRSSYSYYPQTDKLIRADRPPTVVPFGGYTVAKKITELSPKHSILTDLIYEWNTIPHRSGTTPKAINVVAGDGHAVGFIRLFNAVCSRRHVLTGD